MKASSKNLKSMLTQKQFETLRSDVQKATNQFFASIRQEVLESATRFAQVTVNAQKPNHMTREEFGEQYGFHINTVDQLRLSGEIQWFRIGRKIFIIRPDEKQLAQRRAVV